MRKEKIARILVLDDDRSLRLLLASLLTPYYEVKTVASGAELRETLKTFQPDLAIMDVCMPEEDGWQICAGLRQERKFDHLPVIFLSSMSDEASVRKGFSTGGDYCLPKPFELRELMRVVEALIGRRHRYPDESTIPALASA